MKNQAVTAFPNTEHNLKDLIRRIDVERFRKERIPACSFLSSPCMGMCCSLPVAVTREETEVLNQLAKNKANLLKKMGIDIRGSVAKIDARTQRRYLTKKHRSFQQLNKIIYNLITEEKNSGALDFKVFTNFIHTCLFTLKDGGCALQRLSQQEGFHKWYYKPFNCWKYPLSIAHGYLTLPQNSGNPHFPCNKKRRIPAYEGLKEELSFLGKIVNKDILKEISA